MVPVLARCLEEAVVMSGSAFRGRRYRFINFDSEAPCGRAPSETEIDCVTVDENLRSGRLRGGGLTESACVTTLALVSL